MNKSLIANANFRICNSGLRGGKRKRKKIIPDATVLKDNKYRKSLCDIDVL